MSLNISWTIFKQKLTIVHKKKSDFPPASQQKTAVEYYLQTSTGLNEPISFFIIKTTYKSVHKYSLNDIQLKKLTIVYEE